MNFKIESIKLDKKKYKKYNLEQGKEYLKNYCSIDINSRPIKAYAYSSRIECHHTYNIYLRLFYSAISTLNLSSLIYLWDILPNGS